jgi:hypothetical protein
MRSKTVNRAGMRKNPLVCVLAEEFISPQDWASVIVLVKYEELPDIGPHGTHRQHAYDLLQRRAMWWEPGYVETVLRGKARPMQFLYFRIHIEQISGHRGVPDSIPEPKSSVAQPRIAGWIRKVFGRSAHKSGTPKRGVSTRRTLRACGNAFDVSV